MRGASWSLTLQFCQSCERANCPVFDPPSTYQTSVNELACKSTVKVVRSSSLVMMDSLVRDGKNDDVAGYFSDTEC